MNNRLIDNPDFKPTQEQIDALNAFTDNKILKINARSGSGKTSTLQYLTENNPNLKILYFAFNKTMAEEAKTRFPANVDCMTTHSMAYRAVGYKYREKISGFGLKGSSKDIVAQFKLSSKPYIKKKDEDRKGVSDIFMANLIKYTVNSFEQSDQTTLTEQVVPNRFKKSIALAVKKKEIAKSDATLLMYDLVKYAKALWELRINMTNKWSITHDTYMKLWQLTYPDLSGYDAVFLDESQDTNNCLFQILKDCDDMRDDLKIVFVGDTYQNIYGFRGARNVMDELECEETSLTKSFRFGVNLAKEVKNLLSFNKKDQVEIVGNENVKTKVLKSTDKIKIKGKTVHIFRTNGALIAYAVSLLQENPDTKIRINTDITGYIKELQSARNLYIGDRSKVTSPSLDTYESWNDLKLDAEHDPSKGNLVSIIEKGRDTDIIEHLQEFKSSFNANIILTTAHKSKGLEYDNVVLHNDFQQIERRQLNNGRTVHMTLPDAELNLLYVAMTRAKKVLKLNNVLEDAIRINNTKGLEVMTEEEWDWFVKGKHPNKSTNQILKNIDRALALDPFGDEFDEKDVYLESDVTKITNIKDCGHETIDDILRKVSKTIDIDAQLGLSHCIDDYNEGIDDFCMESRDGYVYKDL